MTPTPQLSLGLVLTAAAGFTDAIGFIELGGHYTSFMSGNTTQLGDAVGNGLWPLAILSLGLVALFFVGSTIGVLTAMLGGTRWGSAAVTALVLAGTAAALILAIFGVSATVAMLPLATAAGAQNAILPSTGSVRLGTTFVTGTLFAAGADLARAFRRTAPPWRWAQHLLVWASLFVGALLGAIAYSALKATALAIPAAIYFAFLIAFILRRPAKVIP